MKLARAALAVPVLLLLTWLLLQGMNPDAPRYDRAFNALDRFAMLESAMRRDVLMARAGILRNYDRLVREADALSGALEPLRANLRFDPAAEAVLLRLADLVSEEQALVERFNSANALLQNSLAYFAMVTERLEGPDGDRPAHPVIGPLAAAMLRFTRDPLPAAAAALEVQLDRLEVFDDAEGVGRFAPLLAHGRLIHRTLPGTDGMLKRLLTLPSNDAVNALRASVATRQVAAREESERYRLLLYATSVVLVGLLVHLGIRLRGRALALQRRAGFERIAAGVSARFINARADALDAHVERALGELAASIDADRAYFVTAGQPPIVRVWRRDEAMFMFPLGWPVRALRLAADFTPAATGLIHVPRPGRVKNEVTRTALRAAGLRGWACIVGPDGTALLGFDALRRGPITRTTDLGFLRPAFDVIANAVDRRALELERSRLEASLQQTRRLETVGTLASGVAHNFNNIVGAILGYTEMAEAEVPPSARVAHHLDKIRRAGERARDVVDQILRFGKSRELRRTPLTVRALLGDTQALLLAALPPQITLIVQPAPADAVIVGDLAQLQQVILNLCNNAAQAMDGVGEIELAIDLENVMRPRPLSDGELTPGPYVRIAVSDRGRGMDDAVKQRIFEPFFTTRATGNGLGLATVREIVRAHGGVMHVASAPGAGTRMEAWLPAADGTDAGRGANAGGGARSRGTAYWGAADGDATDGDAADGGELPLGRGETVLVFDPDGRRLLQHEEMLAALGYEPAGFVRADDAATAHGLRVGRFDAIIVCHHDAPAGVAVAAALNATAPRLPIVLATLRADAPDAEGLAAAGIAEVIRCPLVAAEIAVALQRCWRRAGGGAEARRVRETPAWAPIAPS